jgi:hypothetical protein
MSRNLFKGLGDFLVGFARLILVCGAVVLLVRGLDWIFSKTLPLNAIGIPPLFPSIIVICPILLIAIWVSEKPTRRLVKEEKRRAVVDEQTVMPLGDELRWNENRETQFHAISELGKLGSLQAVKVFCEDLVDSKGDLRTCVWNTLVSMGDKAVAELGLVLWDTRWEKHKQARFYSASALGKIGSPKAIKELCAALTPDFPYSFYKTIALT